MQEEQSQPAEQTAKERRALSLLRQLLFPPKLREGSAAQRLAYLGVTAALCIAVNTFEIKFFTVQFSLTLFMSVIAGILIGPLFGGAAVLLGDGIGYIISGMGFPYYWWVALSCVLMAAVAGFVMRIPFRFKGSVYVKLGIICVLVFFLCSLAVNTTGMYYLGLPLYLPPAVRDAAGRLFGGELTFWNYFVIRFFVLGQIWNSLFNYLLLFAVVPLLNAIKPLKLNLV